MEFFNDETRPPDRELLHSLAYIGQQIGQFSQRTDAEKAMREISERFQGLTELSSDWHWEQDDQYRFTILTGGVLPRAGIDPVKLIGKTRWDNDSSRVAAEEWAAHRQLLDERREIRDFTYPVLGLDGEQHYICISGKPIYDESGRFKGYRGVGKCPTRPSRTSSVITCGWTRRISQGRKTHPLSKGAAKRPGDLRTVQCGALRTATKVL